MTATNSIDNSSKKAEYYRDNIIPAMNKVRQAADSLEMIVDAKLWPLPTYAEMLFIK
jgi:glutamine synthetase